MSIINTCDLLDEFPDTQVCPPVLSGQRFLHFGGKTEFGGLIMTVKCFEDNSRVKETLATPGQSRVLVVDGGASMQCALMGDLIAESAVRNHWTGVVIYGCVRDVDALVGLNLGVLALAATPQKSTRKGVGDINVPISFGGLTIESGMYLYADRNGLLVANRPLVPV